MEETTERSNRRSSIGRALGKLKDVMRRRRSSVQGVSTTPLEPAAETPGDKAVETPTQDTTQTSATTEQPSADLSKAVEDSPDKSATQASPESAGIPLRLDSGEVLEVSEEYEPLLPAVPLRTGFTAARTRAVFEKYGIEYETADSKIGKEMQKDTPRVEKPIRIRIHWTCHECKTGFGGNRACTRCGHRRCSECPRSPAKRVKEMLEGTKQLEQLEEQVARSTEQHESVVVPVTEEQEASIAPLASVTLDDSATDTKPTVASNEKPEEDRVVSHRDFDTTRHQYLIQQRPRAGIQMVLPPNSDDGFARQDKSPMDGPGMVATVHRVYKKPRQRVRWYCDQCQNLLMDRQRCRGCGHPKCEFCTRLPYVTPGLSLHCRAKTCIVRNELRSTRTLRSSSPSWKSSVSYDRHQATF